MIQKSLRRGFTLVELSLSMVFISLLGLAIALIITNIVSAYERGNTLNKVNTFGMDIIDDIRTAVQNSSSRSLIEDCYRYYYDSTVTGDEDTKGGAAYQWCRKDGGYKFVSAVRYANVTTKSTAKDTPVYGAFCTGNYTYIWNSGYFDDTKAGTMSTDVKRIKYDGYTEDFRLLKVKDDRREICINLLKDDTETITYPSADQQGTPLFIPDDVERLTGPTTDIVDLILSDNDNNNLAIYDLSVAPPAESGSRYNIFYAVSFILGTTGGGADILANGKSCTAPNDFSETENFNYCAINKFSFGAQSTGAYRKNQI